MTVELHILERYNKKTPYLQSERLRAMSTERNNERTSEVREYRTQAERTK